MLRHYSNLQYVTHNTAIQLYLSGNYSMAISQFNLIWLLFLWQLDTKIATSPIYNMIISNTYQNKTAHTLHSLAICKITLAEWPSGIAFLILWSNMRLGFLQIFLWFPRILPFLQLRSTLEIDNNADNLLDDPGKWSFIVSDQALPNIKKKTQHPPNRPLLFLYCPPLPTEETRFEGKRKLHWRCACGSSLLVLCVYVRGTSLALCLASRKSISLPI